MRRTRYTLVAVVAAALAAACSPADGITAPRQSSPRFKATRATGTGGGATATASTDTTSTRTPPDPGVTPGGGFIGSGA
jgi:opacity protein-like surface antigen